MPDHDLEATCAPRRWLWLGSICHGVIAGVEGMGAVRCGCAADCWCKRPILSTFRWVLPWGHRGPEG